MTLLAVYIQWGRTQSLNTGTIHSVADSEDSIFDDEWAGSTKTLHLSVVGYASLLVEVHPGDAIEKALEARLAESWTNLDPTIKFRYSDPNGSPIPLDYDSVYDQMMIIGQPYRTGADGGPNAPAVSPVSMHGWTHSWAN